MRAVCVLLLLGGLAGWLGAPAARAAPPVVIELYTAQGCNMCPPADAYLEALARRSDVIALSIHVKYWDYLGWHDPFATSTGTQRQRAYGQQFRLRYVYTPQIVVDGMIVLEGTDAAALEYAIAKRLARARAMIEIGWKRRPESLTINIGAAAHAGPPADIWWALYDERHVTHVTAGENAGRTLVNINVVRELRRIGHWRGEEMSIEMPSGFLTSERDGCAVIVQEANAGAILGARDWKLARSR